MAGLSTGGEKKSDGKAWRPGKRTVSHIYEKFPRKREISLPVRVYKGEGGNAMVNAQESGEGREERLQRLMQTYGNALVGLCTGILGDSDLA